MLNMTYHLLLEIAFNFIRPDLVGDERKKFFKEEYGGRNNPIYRNKTNEEIEKWMDDHMRGDNASNAKYEYTITRPNGEIIIVYSLKDYCKKNGYVYETILSMCKINTPRKKGVFKGWRVERKLRTDRNIK